MTAHEDRPYGLADRYGEGWLRNGHDGTYTTYPAMELGEWTYEQLDADRGPLRPVVAIGQEESEALTEALVKAGKKATATLLAAVHHTAQKLTATGSAAALTAGRPGSWEATVFRTQIAWMGEDIAASRVDDEALEVAVAALTRWTTGPTQVELADGLASILGDAAKRAGGWAAVTDQWLDGNETVEHWTSAYRRAY